MIDHLMVQVGVVAILEEQVKVQTLMAVVVAVPTTLEPTRIIRAA